MRVEYKRKKWVYFIKKPNPAQERGNQIINFSAKAAVNVRSRRIKVIGVNYQRRPLAGPQKRVYLHPNPTANLAGVMREECLFG